LKLKETINDLNMQLEQYNSNISKREVDRIASGAGAREAD
jgi:hypothetical protein